MSQESKPPARNIEKRSPTLTEIYKDPTLSTLYRYENVETPYDESREGIVSRKEIVGEWFTDNVKDLGTYIKMRQPGGKIVTVRMPKEGLKAFDAANIEATKEMDREAGNFIIPSDLQSASRLEVPLSVESKNMKKFQFNEWQNITDFLESELTPEKLVEFASKSSR